MHSFQTGQKGEKRVVVLGMFGNGIARCSRQATQKGHAQDRILEKADKSTWATHSHPGRAHVACSFRSLWFQLHM